MSETMEARNMKNKNKEMMDDRDEGLFVRLLMLDELKISKQESCDNIVKTFSYEDLKPEKLQTIKRKKYDIYDKLIDFSKSNATDKR